MPKADMIMVAILCAGLGAGMEPARLSNPGFELGPPRSVPLGWGVTPPMHDAGYRFEKTQAQPYAGAAAGRLWRGTPRGPASGVLDRNQLTTGVAGAASQPIDIGDLRNHRVRFEAAVRVEPGSDPVGLWLRVEGPDGKTLYLDNMMDRPITSTVWNVYKLEAYVPPDAKGMLVGLLINGSGAAEIDSTSLIDLGAAGAPPSGEAKAYLDRAIDLLSRRHINRDKVDWSEVRNKAYTTASGATEPRQTYQAIREVIRTLGERHTYLLPPTMPLKVGEQPRAQPLPEGKMVGHIGVIALPRLHRDSSNPQDDGAPYRNAIRTFLHDADERHACGWIIDLRRHTGGNMWPGVNGLAPILGHGPYGAFVNGPSRKPWPQEPLTPDELVKASMAPVAVLIGPNTASAGEMIAIAVSGRPGSHFFGQPTAGLTTSNQSVVLSDRAVLALTSSFAEDRKGRRFEGSVRPDDVTPLDGAEAAARKWLNDLGCR